MAPQRDENGRFVKGHKGGPGRPKRSTEEKYLAALSRRVTLKDWEKIIDVAIARAKTGDSTARQWLSDYLMGKPVQRQEVTGADGGPIVVVNWDDSDPT
jgi:hypothetical protein